MDSLEMWGFIVMSISSLVIVFPYKIHVKLQEGVHSAVHVKLVVIPISRESGPEMITFFGPSAREERRHKYGTSQRFFFFNLFKQIQGDHFSYQAPPLSSQLFCFFLSPS